MTSPSCRTSACPPPTGKTRPSANWTLSAPSPSPALARTGRCPASRARSAIRVLRAAARTATNVAPARMRVPAAVPTSASVAQSVIGPRAPFPRGRRGAGQGVHRHGVTDAERRLRAEVTVVGPLDGHTGAVRGEPPLAQQRPAGPHAKPAGVLGRGGHRVDDVLGVGEPDAELLEALGDRVNGQ